MHIGYKHTATYARTAQSHDPRQMHQTNRIQIAFDHVASVKRLQVNENTIVVHDQTKTIDTPIDQVVLSYYRPFCAHLLTLVSIHTSAHDAEQRTTHVTPSFVSDQSGRQTSKKGSDLRLHDHN